MKAKIKIEKEVELKTLEVSAPYDSWDEEDDYISCREGDNWCPIIDIDTGTITNWEKGTSANIHFKIVDAGSYFLKDGEGNTVLSIEEDYVPEMMCPKENGYGDYIIMDIDGNGKIANWKPSLEGFIREEDF